MSWRRAVSVTIGILAASLLLGTAPCQADGYDQKIDGDFTITAWAFLSDPTDGDIYTTSETIGFYAYPEYNLAILQNNSTSTSDLTYNWTWSIGVGSGAGKVTFPEQDGSSGNVNWSATGGQTVYCQGTTYLEQVWWNGTAAGDYDPWAEMEVKTVHTNSALNKDCDAINQIVIHVVN